MAQNGRSWNGTADNYRYGMSGKEKLNEWQGNGNSYDFDARILDPRLGRWLSRDPKHIKYPFYSPYLAFGNNSIFYTDPGGETLKVAYSDPKLKEQYASVVSKAFNGKVKADISKDNIVTFHQVPGTKLDQYEQASFKVLKTVENHEITAQYEIISNNVDVPAGDYYGSRIDVADVEAYGNDNNLMTSKTVLVHESVEQLEKAKMLADPESADAQIANEPEGFDYAHGQAVNAEEGTSNIDRSNSDPTAKILGSKDGKPTETGGEMNVKQKQADGTIVTGTLESTSENGVLINQKFTPNTPKNENKKEN